jgi:hypothetical protein
MLILKVSDNGVLQFKLNDFWTMSVQLILGDGLSPKIIQFKGRNVTALPNNKLQMV